MTLVTKLIILLVFAAVGWGLGELLVSGSWVARISGAVGGLAGGFALRDLLKEKLGSLVEDDVREPPEA